MQALKIYAEALSVQLEPHVYVMAGSKKYGDSKSEIREQRG